MEPLLQLNCTLEDTLCKVYLTSQNVFRNLWTKFEGLIGTIGIVLFRRKTNLGTIRSTINF